MLSFAKKKSYQSVLYFIFLFFFLFFLEKTKILPFSFLHKSVSSWQGKNYRVFQQVRSPISQLENLWRASSRLEEMELKYAGVAAELSKLDSLEKENQELRRILENSDRVSGRRMISSPLLSYATTILPVGTVDGVREGAVVLAKRNLLGRVIKVTEKQAQVELLKDIGEGGIVAETENGAKGLVKGNGRDILFTEVSGNETLKEAELVLTSGQLGIEKGLVIGQIEIIKEENPALSSKTAIIRPFLDIYQLSIVEIE